MKYFLYLFGFLPSIIWLLFYLRKDAHPESNRTILRVFFLGTISAFLAIVAEKAFQGMNSFFKISPFLYSLLTIFIGGALVEEYLKYEVVKRGAFRGSEPDESSDVILYLIISALGFAAVENILVLTNYHPVLTSAKAIEVMSWRFVSATFLHALCSGLFGYFLALSFLHEKKRKRLFLAGLFSATLLHGVYNFSIMKIEGFQKLILPLFILLSLAWFVSRGFEKLRREKNVCLIK